MSDIVAEWLINSIDDSVALNLAVTIMVIGNLATVNLGYNEQLGTGHFLFVITGLICVLK